MIAISSAQAEGELAEGQEKAPLKGNASTKMERSKIAVSAADSKLCAMGWK